MGQLLMWDAVSWCPRGSSAHRIVLKSIQCECETGSWKLRWVTCPGSGPKVIHRVRIRIRLHVWVPALYCFPFRYPTFLPRSTESYKTAGSLWGGTFADLVLWKQTWILFSYCCFTQGVSLTAQRAAIVVGVELPVYDITKKHLILSGLMGDTVYTHFLYVYGFLKNIVLGMHEFG